MNFRSKVLIVDDESGPRESLKMVLAPFCQVEEVSDGLQALEFIRQQTVDLVTLDLRMPGMEGVAVLTAIKKYHPKIQVLIITGYGTVTSAIELVRLGACGYLMKPFEIPRVLAEVTLAIKKKRKSDRLDRPFN